MEWNSDREYELPRAQAPFVRASWTDDQVESLAGFQRNGRWHEFTCPRCGSTLIPRTDGWVCWRDDYTQDWAHEFMTNWTWQLPAAWSGDGPVPGVIYCATCEHSIEYHTNDDLGCSVRVDGARCGCREEWSA